MKKLQLAADLIKEYTTKDGTCSLSKKKLGELLHHRYPSEFKSPENGRETIRTVTGSHGKELRKDIKTRIEWKGLALPEPEKERLFKVSNQGKKDRDIIRHSFPLLR